MAAAPVDLPLSRHLLSLPLWRVTMRNIQCLLAFACVITVTVIIFSVSELWATSTRSNRTLGQLNLNPEHLVSRKSTAGNRSESRAVSKSLLKQPTTNCPELKFITNLVGDREMDLTHGIPMEELEKMIFQNQTQRIRGIVSNGNHEMQGLHGTNATAVNGSLAGRPLIADNLSKLQVLVSDYLYLPGGHWSPATCLPRWKVAIVVPYRNRTEQLSMFLRYMVPFLQKQLLEFAIYIVNQENDSAFNRGMLLNVGFLESLNFSHWDCFVFHDVDHLPQSEFNPYGCLDLPRHFVGGVDIRKYRLPYSTWVGGVYGFTTQQFWHINGFANVYWGWCCEDDDLEIRVRSAALNTHRYMGALGHYKAIRAHHEKSTKGLGQLEKRSRVLLKKLRSRLKTDGLNSLVYKTPHLELHTLYTNISVDIHDTPNSER